MIAGAGSISRPGAGQEYLPALDGLRGVSILLVVVSHMGLPHVVPGAFGVTLFFFISGFLITRQLAGGLARQGRVGFAGFYLRRALRLMPAGLVYIGLAGLAYSAAGGRIAWAGWLAALLYGANYYDLWVGYHAGPGGMRNPFGILWSLAVEEHFYALWPLCLALLWHCPGWGRGRGRGRGGRWAVAAAAVLAVCAGGLLWRGWLWRHCFVPGAPWVCGPQNASPLWRFNRLYTATDARLDSIAWGALLALAPGLAPARARPAAAGAALLALGFCLPGGFARYVLRPSLQGAALCALFPWLLEGRTPVQAALRAKPARLLGRLSYSLYLWHWAAMSAADRLCRNGSVRWVLVAAPLALALAAASYLGVERPMLRVRRRFGSHVAAAA